MPPSFSVIGAGGVGGLLAALLTDHGDEVRLLTRSQSLATIAASGLTFSGPAGTRVVRPSLVADDPAVIGVVDVILVAVKAWQVREVAPTLRPLLGPGTVVLPTQNGVEAAQELAAALGEAHVVPAVAHMIAWAEAPGVVRWIGGPPLLTVGVGSGIVGDTLRGAAQVMREAGIGVKETESIGVVLWEKLLFIAAFAAVGAFLRRPAGEVRASAEGRKLLEAVMHEVAAVAAAEGVALAADVVERAMRRVDVVDPLSTASMHRDLLANRPSELEEILGVVVRRGRAHGVAITESERLYAALRNLAAVGPIPPA